VLAREQPRQDRQALAAAVRGHEDIDRPPDHLLGRIAVDPLGGGTPARDDPAQRRRDDRVVARIRDRGE
jgi:hypothetical protein